MQHSRLSHCIMENKGTVFATNPISNRLVCFYIPTEMKVYVCIFFSNEEMWWNKTQHQVKGKFNNLHTFPVAQAVSGHVFKKSSKSKSMEQTSLRI